MTTLLKLTGIFGSIAFIFSNFGGGSNISSNQKNIKISQESDYNVIIMDKKDMKFGVSEGKPKNSDFYINSNFFSNEGPIGLVVVNGKKINKRSESGGYFYVSNGIPYVRAKSCPTNVKFASQTILWGIDNGRVNTGLLKTSHAKLKRHRTIMGENSKGQIMVISSSSYLSLVTIEEIINFAISKGMTEGILLDGGTSVDYKFSNGEKSVEFSSVPESTKPVLGIKKPTTYIYGNLN